MNHIVRLLLIIIRVINNKYCVDTIHQYMYNNSDKHDKNLNIFFLQKECCSLQIYKTITTKLLIYAHYFN